MKPGIVTLAVFLLGPSLASANSTARNAKALALRVFQNGGTKGENSGRHFAGRVRDGVVVVLSEKHTSKGINSTMRGFTYDAAKGVVVRTETNTQLRDGRWATERYGIVSAK